MAHYLKPLDEFTTYIFKENEVKTNNKRAIKERTFLIGLVIILIGFALRLLEMKYATPILFIGVFISTIGRIVMSGRETSIGHRPRPLTIRSNSIVIGNEQIQIKDKADILINIMGYRGQAIRSTAAFYETNSGNDNTIRIWRNGKEARFKFVLESEDQKDKLIQFCKVHGLNVRK